MQKPEAPSSKLFRSILLLTLAVIAGISLGTLLARQTGYHAQLALRQVLPEQVLPSQILPMRMSRPYGMAPVAFEAYIRACDRSGIHPFRVGQTIGDHPRSVGYHKRDGVLYVKGQRIDYCTAVDLGVFDLTDAKIEQFLDELAKQGFAAWYRHGGKWKGGEHIHAVYAALPMKPQLRRQVSQFLREKRREGELPRWAKKRNLRRYWRG